MRFEFHEEALKEYNQAAIYYAGLGEGIGLRFVDAVEQTIDLILQHPMAGRVILGDARRCLTSAFPYGIFYTIESDHILIAAVAHHSREPFYWRDRIG